MAGRLANQAVLEALAAAVRAVQMVGRERREQPIRAAAAVGREERVRQVGQA